MCTFEQRIGHKHIILIPTSRRDHRSFDEVLFDTERLHFDKEMHGRCGAVSTLARRACHDAGSCHRRRSFRWRGNSDNAGSPRLRHGACARRACRRSGFRIIQVRPGDGRYLHAGNGRPRDHQGLSRACADGADRRHVRLQVSRFHGPRSGFPRNGGQARRDLLPAQAVRASAIDGGHQLVSRPGVSR